MASLIWLVLPVIMTVAMVSALPCCPHQQQMVRINNTILCQDRSLISVYKWCGSFYMIDPSDLTPGEVFKENQNNTKFTLNDNDWYSNYCTGTSLNLSLEDTVKQETNGTQKLAVMVCFEDTEEEDEEHYFLYALCLLISCVFLLATLIIYLWLPELRDLQGKCVLCFILSLMTGYLCLIYLQLPFTSPELIENECVVVAFLTYFWMMSAFFWLNINSFNMWRSAVLAHVSMSERRLMQVYYLAGWGLPLCFLTTAFITHNLPGDHIIRPNFGVRSCWFQGKLELWTYFYGPVLTLLIFNIIYFISTALYLWSDYRSPNPMPRIKSLRTKFCLYFKLFLVMGITWIFEILSSIDNEPWYVTDILNCFQGVIIFVVMIVLRKRVWRALAAKTICGVKFANCWAKMEDEETANEMVDEQQLSTNNISKP